MYGNLWNILTEASFLVKDIDPVPKKKPSDTDEGLSYGIKMVFHSEGVRKGIIYLLLELIDSFDEEFFDLTSKEVSDKFLKRTTRFPNSQRLHANNRMKSLHMTGSLPFLISLPNKEESSLNILCIDEEFLWILDIIKKLITPQIEQLSLSYDVTGAYRALFDEYLKKEDGSKNTGLNLGNGGRYDRIPSCLQTAEDLGHSCLSRVRSLFGSFTIDKYYGSSQGVTINNIRNKVPLDISNRSVEDLSAMMSAYGDIVINIDEALNMSLDVIEQLHITQVSAYISTDLESLRELVLPIMSAYKSLIESGKVFFYLPECKSLRDFEKILQVFTENKIPVSTLFIDVDIPNLVRKVVWTFETLSPAAVTEEFSQPDEVRNEIYNGINFTGKFPKWDE